MPEQITPHIQQFYDDAEVQQIIDASPNLTQQFSASDVQNSKVCVVFPIVRRYAGYRTDQFDLDLFIKHAQVTDLGQLEMYWVKDFIRQRVDIAPVLHAANQITGVDMRTVADRIRSQIKFLQRPENKDLPLASAQMINGLS